jgi:hypothetical protein
MFIGKSNPKNLGPKAVGGDHGISFFSLSWVKNTECICTITILK